MKNIHVLPTEKPSRLHLIEDVLMFTNEYKNSVCDSEVNIYITNDEEIKEGDCFLHSDNTVERASRNLDGRGVKKIILTTDQNLIKDGVQAIDDKFLEWFVNNPNCEEVEIKTRYLHSYKTGENFISFSKTPEFSSRNMQCIKIEPRYEIIIPQEKPKQENCCTPAGQIKRYVDCVGCDKKPKQMSKLTAVEILEIKLLGIVSFDSEVLRNKYKEQFRIAKEMEKEQSQNYAIFAIRCDRTEMRILDFNDYIKLEENENK
jgi:hypothetical protein